MQTEDVVTGTAPFDADRYLSTLRAADLLRTNGKVRQVIGTVIESNGPPMSIGETASIIFRRAAEPVLSEAVGFRDSKVLLMPLGELGRLAVGALVAQIDGNPARDLEVTTAPQLVLRASTGAPPRPDREGR